MNTTILALDLGTHTGWALQHLDGTITSGTEHFKPQRFEGGGMRFLRFKRWLNELLSASNHINAVFFEEVRRHAGVDAAHAYGTFMSHLLRLDSPVQQGQGVGFVVVDWGVTTQTDGRDHVVLARIALAGRVLLDRADWNTLVRDVVMLTPRATRART